MQELRSKLLLLLPHQASLSQEFRMALEGIFNYFLLDTEPSRDEEFL
jgi:hypothetical protein